MRRVLVAVVVAIVALTTITADADAARPRKRAKFAGNGVSLRMGSCVLIDCGRNSQSWGRWLISVTAPCQGTGSNPTELIAMGAGYWGPQNSDGDYEEAVYDLFIARNGTFNKFIGAEVSEDVIGYYTSYYRGRLKGRFTSSVRAVGTFSLSMGRVGPPQNFYPDGANYSCGVSNVPFTLRVQR